MLNFQIKSIHDDRLASLYSLGNAEVRRASHVEPQSVDGKVEWNADMSPSGGPMLGPFDSRGEAIAAEVAWLKVNVLSDGGYEAGEKS